MHLAEQAVFVAIAEGRKPAHAPSKQVSTDAGGCVGLVAGPSRNSEYQCHLRQDYVRR